MSLNRWLKRRYLCKRAILVAYVTEQGILLTVAEKYSVLRRFSPRFLASFQFQSNVGFFCAKVGKATPAFVGETG